MAYMPNEAHDGRNVALNWEVLAGVHDRPKQYLPTNMDSRTYNDFFVPDLLQISDFLPRLGTEAAEELFHMNMSKSWFQQIGIVFRF